MFTPATTARIWLCTQPTDMRKSFTGLSALVKNQLGKNPLSGHYFVFVNQRQTQMKVLYFEPTGYCLWSQRLEQGQYRVKAAATGQRELTPTDWQLLLAGIEVQKSRQFKRYQHRVSAGIG
jgi:transposase